MLLIRLMSDSGADLNEQAGFLCQKNERARCNQFVGSMLPAHQAFGADDAAASAAAGIDPGLTVQHQFNCVQRRGADGFKCKCRVAERRYLSVWDAAEALRRAPSPSPITNGIGMVPTLFAPAITLRSLRNRGMSVAKVC